VKHNEALRSNLSKVQEDMNPIRVLGLFERISKEDCDLLDIHDRCVAARASA
jgi:DNA-directed RNA polymerase III subunit RPC1